jgi:hypothetical protein
VLTETIDDDWAMRLREAAADPYVSPFFTIDYVFSFLGYIA